MAQTVDAGGGVGLVSVSSRGLGLQGKFSPNDLNEYINPPPDPRLQSIIKKMGSPLKHGIIQQTDDFAVGPQKYPFALRFMFNPTTLGVGYAAAEGVLAPSDYTASQAKAHAIEPGSTSLEFNLLFDRTYECAYGPNIHNPRDLRDIGVYRDIAALENVVGARNQFAPADQPQAVIQPMRMIPVYVIFGGGDTNVGLSFVGIIQSISVTYSLFTERMVPSRAGVTIRMTQMLGESTVELAARGGTLLQRAHARGRVSGGGANVAIPYALPR